MGSSLKMFKNRPDMALSAVVLLTRLFGQRLDSVILEITSSLNDTEMLELPQ